MSETPTQAIIKASARGTDVFLEGFGRRVVVREIRPFERLDLMKAVGTQSTNGGFLGTAMMAASVRSVDDEPMPFPHSEANIKFILTKLDFAGWDLVEEYFSSIGEERKEDKEAAKN